MPVGPVGNIKMLHRFFYTSVQQRVNGAGHLVDLVSMLVLLSK